MTKRTNAKFKISRRMGKAVWGSAKDPVNKGKAHPPGQHGPTNGAFRRSTNYGTQLRAKQLLKGYYGNITEKQFRRIFAKAVQMKGDTSQNLIALLESRLDTVVYRANFVGTVFAARQFVTHRHVTVNGKRVNIPSYQVKVGDVVEVREKSRQIPVVIESTQKQERQLPDYYEADGSNVFKVKFNRLPELGDVPFPVVMEPNLVIEFYSR